MHILFGSFWLRSVGLLNGNIDTTDICAFGPVPAARGMQIPTTLFFTSRKNYLESDNPVSKNNNWCTPHELLLFSVRKMVNNFLSKTTNGSSEWKEKTEFAMAFCLCECISRQHFNGKRVDRLSAICSTASVRVSEFECKWCIYHCISAIFKKTNAHFKRIIRLSAVKLISFLLSTLSHCLRPSDAWIR